MNKVIDILKVKNYDKFKCIADKCKFTCCEGWDIGIDDNIYTKWKNESQETEYILDNVKSRKCGSKTEYFINKETYEPCPFLDKGGLCQIVKNHGEEYLSLTCHTFPRIENSFEDKKEFSLSCACPEVVELISSISGKINMISQNNVILHSDLMELKIREAMVNILQQEDLSLEYKLIINFQMLLTILENENSKEIHLLEELEKHKSREYQQGLISMFEEMELNIVESMEELNNLFLDITENYKEVSGLELLLKDISIFAEQVEVENLSQQWYEYKGFFEKHKYLIENCIVAKVLSSCVSNDIEEMIISFQMIVLEYLLVRYAVFLRYCIGESEEIDIEDVKDYIVAFSRIIGNNTEAVIEFLAEGFGEEVLEIGYLSFISLF